MVMILSSKLAHVMSYHGKDDDNGESFDDEQTQLLVGDGHLHGGRVDEGEEQHVGPSLKSY